jgi:hypothetical protein
LGYEPLGGTILPYELLAVLNLLLAQEERIAQEE